MTPIVYVMAFIVPSAFMAVNKITSVEGTLLFGQPFDAQRYVSIDILTDSLLIGILFMSRIDKFFHFIYSLLDSI